MGVVVLRRYIDVLTIIINFSYPTCISSFFGSSIPTCSFLKYFFGLVIYKRALRVAVNTYVPIFRDLQTCNGEYTKH